jgi:tetratricopeptide (TPR) repeat protein
LKKLTLYLLLFIAFSANAQHVADSLRLYIQTAKADSNKVNALNALSKENIMMGNYPDAEKFANEASLLAEQIGFHAGNGRALNMIGNINNVQGNSDKAVEYYLRAVKIREKIGDKAGMSATLSNIGIIYDHKGEYPKALNYFIKSLKISEEIKDTYGVASTMNNMGNVYLDQRNYSKALEYQQQSLKLHEQSGDKMGMATAYGNIANVYSQQGNYAKALEFNKQSAEIMKETGDKKGMGRALSNLGSTLTRMGQNEKALEYYMESLVIREQIGHKSGIINSLNGMAEAYFGMKEYNKALQYLDKSEKMGRMIGDKSAVMDSYEGFAQIYEEMGEPKKALAYFKLYSVLKDSLLNDENALQIAQMNAQFDSDKKDNEIKLLNTEKEKQDAVNAAEKKKQRIITGAVSLGLILVVIFALVVIRSNRQKQKANIKITHQKEIIEEKNREVHDSITYAKRIQTAILPPDKLVKSHLANSFILFKPKDIVSGDFYWMAKAKGKILIAAADCTGHGVPGAIVSVVCSNALNRAVKEFGIHQPSMILDKVTELVVQTFEKSENEVKDGMDISLCSIDPETFEIEWAGANNPIWIIKAIDKAITEIKGDKQPIGRSDIQKTFTNHSLQLQKNDSIYLFTDGYADQFGGEKGKKFKYKQLQELILAHTDKHPESQKKELDSAIENWRRDLEQVDDILVIGIKL